jgi:hypothetical protein
MLHGKFTYLYLDNKHWHLAQRTVKVPTDERPNISTSHTRETF